MVNPKNASGNCSCAARKARADAFQSHFPTRINVALKTVGISHRGGEGREGRRTRGARKEIKKEGEEALARENGSLGEDIHEKERKRELLDGTLTHMENIEGDAR